MSPPSAPEEDLFFAALEQPDAAAREAFLTEACGGDSALRAAVETMLADHERAGTLFQEVSAGLPAAESIVADHEAAIGKSISSYTLTRLLGEGGSGIVYEAAQSEPVRRKVALKILKLGMDTRQIIARFEAERQALAMMEHPHIARVIDAGATKSGRPYFVMELVEGSRITEFCRETHAPLEQRLRLMLEVCAAVHHAHQKGIIHRDLKPSNILITGTDGDPSPKVIDFGIAKALADDGIGGAGHTQQSQLVGTPAYMSPEQLLGRGDIDTRSDVYSLGIVLYELATGRPPFEHDELLQTGIESMQRLIVHTDPRSPSAAGLLEVPKSSGRELDWIILKALEKDRDRRYSSVRELADDLERFLRDEPVLAHPPSRWYRLRKLVHRNRLASAAIAAAIILLVAGFATSTWLFVRAKSAEAQQSQLRLEAEEREHVARAAIFLMQAKPADANAEIERMGSPLTQPSLEATNVYRDLSVWSAMNGDWGTAARRLLALSKVSRFDESDLSDNATRSLLPIAPTLIESGNLRDYRAFREWLLEKLGATHNPVAAEHVLKICLQRHVSHELLARLRPLAGVAEESLTDPAADDVTERRLEAWRCAVLALWHLRNGHAEDAEHWCDRSLSLNDEEISRLAYAHAVRAMARRQLGHPEEADDDLRLARSQVEDAFTPRLGFDRNGLWQDWLSVRQLLEEANGDQNHK